MLIAVSVVLLHACLADDVAVEVSLNRRALCGDKGLDLVVAGCGYGVPDLQELPHAFEASEVGHY